MIGVNAQTSVADARYCADSRVRAYKLLAPTRRGVARVDDRRVLSGILHVIRNGLRWRDAPAAYGPCKTLRNRFVRWSRAGVFSAIFASLAGAAGEPETVMIDATHLKAHRTAASLLQKKGGHGASGARAAG